jgi:2-keto-4-pentenoate hydratase/2-oxohepta-3-ene-1,7-dioic acid hydratase in catechol pathway
MKIARYEHVGRIAYGTVAEGIVRELAGSPFEGRMDLTGRTAALSAVKLLAPVERPRIFGVGFNYVAHIKETGWEMPEIPMVFVKPESALIGPGDPIVYPKGAENIHYEAELVVVIGRRARRVKEQDALNYVLGYTCGNDVSDRVIQAKEMKFGCLFAGKAFETFAPIGPFIATDLDPSNLRVTGRLNGVVKQQGSTSDLLFPVPKLVAYLSTFMPLLPGDIIMTGTPSGVGPIRPGDTFEVEIEGVGTLSNSVVEDTSAAR